MMMPRSLIGLLSSCLFEVFLASLRGFCSSPVTVDWSVGGPGDLQRVGVGILSVTLSKLRLAHLEEQTLRDQGLLGWREYLVK